MPIYEYCCARCGEKFELFVRSATQQTTPTCPRCGSTETRKALAPFGVGATGRSSSASTSASCGSGPT